MIVTVLFVWTADNSKEHMLKTRLINSGGYELPLEIDGYTRS